MDNLYKSIIEISDVTIGYQHKDSHYVVNEHLNAQVYKGEMVCLLGPNGSGKSTLIRTLAGMQPLLAGTIFIEQEDITTLSLDMLARKMSVVLTDSVNVPNMTVFDVVALGRFPYTNWFGTITESDKAIITDSLQKVGLQDYATRKVEQLSDGEKQRTMIAKALAQDTPFVILDEPTAHLDLPNRIEVMKLLRELAHSTSKSILLSTHELDLALQVSDRIWLMQKDKPMLCGTPEDLVLNGSFEQAFKKHSFDFDISNGLFKICYDYRKTVSVSGDAIKTFWTIRALHRHGIDVSQTQQETHIEITDTIWKIKKAENEFTCNSIFDLLRKLSTLD